MSDYTISLELTIEADSIEEAIKYFKDDADDPSLEHMFTVDGASFRDNRETRYRE